MININLDGYTNENQKETAIFCFARLHNKGRCSIFIIKVNYRAWRILKANSLKLAQ